jgi:protein-tyrosine phosphatase
MTTISNLPLAGIHNVRDLGGLPHDGGGATVRGRMLRACAMRGLAPEGVAALRALGVVTVIDLRGPAEAAEAPSPLEGARGVETLRLPLFADLAPVDRMVADDPAFRLETRYLAALDRAAPRFAEVFRAIAAAGPGTVLVHCTAGKDRTGLVAALTLRLAGVPAAAAAADYAATATAGAALIGTLRARALARGAAPAGLEIMLGSPAATMLATLAEIDGRMGGARGYLQAAGVPAADLDRVAARLSG